jgi:hypothetical protein
MSERRGPQDDPRCDRREASKRVAALAIEDADRVEFWARSCVSAMRQAGEPTSRCRIFDHVASELREVAANAAAAGRGPRDVEHNQSHTHRPAAREARRPQARG